MIFKKAVIAGYLSLDITSSLHDAVPSKPTRRDASQIGQAVLSPGGLAKLALALHHLGVPTGLIGKVGDDAFGEVFVRVIKDKAPTLVDSLILDPSVPAAYKLNIGDAHYYFPGANKSFYASDLPRDILREADLFHFGHPALMRSIYRGDGGELVSILQRVRREGLSTSLDFGMPEMGGAAGAVDWSVLLENALPLVDVLIADIPQLLFFLKPEGDQQYPGYEHVDGIGGSPPGLLHMLSERVMKFGVNILMVNLGEQGFYLRTNGEHAWKRPGRGLSGLGEAWFDREIREPVFASGDQEIINDYDHGLAGFLAGLLADSDPETALKLAAAASASKNQEALRSFWDANPEIRRDIEASS
ncbi:MAG: PfkB family carbohydrate kinase [Brevefilum sp.]|nr:PfkB family carbohydrate kinase [Brevefilum sp.]